MLGLLALGLGYSIVWLDGIRSFMNSYRQVSGMNLSVYKKAGLFVLLYTNNLKVNLLQKLNGNVEQIELRKYILTFSIGGNVYKLLVKEKRGPKTISQVVEQETNRDVTGIVAAYAGPSEDFFNSDVRPMDIGLKDIEITLTDGTSRKVNKDTSFAQIT
jgi:hypothetical protein